MSLSTVTTTTYELTKYSKAYNHTPNVASSQLTDLEWQHFVNPVIRLTLDAKKSPDGCIESYRLKIVWLFSTGMDAMDVDQREVVFEDLDLVAYSTSTSSLPAPQNIPLKAVYQGSVVGLRYQFPLVPSTGQIPQYRRFQVVFCTDAAASAFIASIRFVCPCKPNPGPPARHPRPSASVAPEQGMHIPTPASHTPSYPPTRPSMASNKAPPPPRRIDTMAPTATPKNTDLSVSSYDRETRASSEWAAPGSDRSSAGSSTATMSSTATYTTSDMPRNSPTRPSTSAFVPAYTSGLAHTATPDLGLPAPTVSLTPPVPRSSSSAAHSNSESGPTRAAYAPGDKAPLAEHDSSSDLDGSFPSSSVPYPSSTANSSPPARTRPLASSPALMPPPPVPPQASFPRSSQPTSTHDSQPTQTETGTKAPGARASQSVKADMVATLRDSAGLYELEREELEKMVEQVLREDGFCDLMRSLDRMWKVKGLVGVHS